MVRQIEHLIKDPRAKEGLDATEKRIYGKINEQCYGTYRAIITMHHDRAASGTVDSVYHAAYALTLLANNVSAEGNQYKFLNDISVRVCKALDACEKESAEKTGSAIKYKSVSRADSHMEMFNLILHGNASWQKV
jgi:hypothetical protein